MRKSIFVAIGVLGSALANLVGGWDSAIINLLIVMGLDLVTGILTAFFGKSTKTKSGGLSSHVMRKGLLKKATILIVVILANVLDNQLNVVYIRDAVCIAFICNEALSILENAGVLGVPIPRVVKNAIEILKGSDKDEQ